MKAVVRKGLAAPGIVALATLIGWGIEGPTVALGILAVGGAVIVVRHLRSLQLLTDWAGGPLDAPVPEGTGAWTDVFAAMYKRTRTRIAMQRELKHLIERFRRAADAMPDGVVLLDAENRIGWANPRAMEQLGLEMPQDRGRPIVNLVRVPEFLRYIASGDFTEPIVTESLRDRRTLSLHLVPFGMDEKLLLSRDVTQAEAIASMRRDFIANVSHELKTPLTVISGFLETLQDVDFEPRQRTRYLQLMQDQSRNMQRLVDDLLALSALESENNPLSDAEFAIVPLLLEISADAKALSNGAHQITLGIGEAASVVGSRDEMKSALGNLVSNGIRYTPPEGKVALNWRIDADGRGVFSVQDTGIGIMPEHIPRLTERFYRVDRSRSRATGGTGLGLAIVKHVLLRHQAELDIESRPGEGSLFTVTLPAKRVRPVVESVAHSETGSATSAASPSAADSV